MESIKLKLSELPDEEQLTYEYANCVYTVAELKREILILGEPHHERKNWCIAVDAVWVPSADDMITNYIENAADDMYEDWDEKATDCIDAGVVEAIQLMLEEMFASVRGYWTFGKDVEIDIFPSSDDKGAIDFRKLAYLIQSVLVEEINLISVIGARQELIDSLSDEVLTCDEDQRTEPCKAAVKAILKKYLFG